MLRYKDITGEDIDRVEKAINRLRFFEPSDGYYLAFSGGKDSVVIKALADMAQVKYDAHYSVTTVDPPELVRFIKHQHPDVIFEKPKLSMQKLIVQHNMPPTRKARYCCKDLKEVGGKGRVVVTGVRWAESARRRATHGLVGIKRQVLNDDNDESRRMVEQCYRTQKTMLNPIIDWEDSDVWDFIHGNNVPYCSLYDEGFKRLGCVGCPIANHATVMKDFERWPQYRKLYIKAFDDMLLSRKEKGKDDATGKWTTGEKVFQWWISKAGRTVPLNQVQMDLEDEQE